VSAFPLPGGDPIQLNQTVDGYLWLALLVRDSDKPPALLADDVREAIAGKILSIGVVPNLPDSIRVLPAGRAAGAPSPVALLFDIRNVQASRGLQNSQNRVPQYRPLRPSSTTDVFSLPGIIEVTLPAKSDLYLWNNIDPLEAGVGLLPPSL